MNRATAPDPAHGRAFVDTAKPRRKAVLRLAIRTGTDPVDPAVPFVTGELQSSGDISRTPRP